MARKAAAMRRQMAAEVSAAGGGQAAAAIVHSMVSEAGGNSTGGGDGASVGEGGYRRGNSSASGGDASGVGGGEADGGGGGGRVVDGGSLDNGGNPTMFDVSELGGGSVGHWVVYWARKRRSVLHGMKVAAIVVNSRLSAKALSRNYSCACSLIVSPRTRSYRQWGREVSHHLGSLPNMTSLKSPIEQHCS